MGRGRAEIRLNQLTPATSQFHYLRTTNSGSPVFAQDDSPWEVESPGGFLDLYYIWNNSAGTPSWGNPTAYKIEIRDPLGTLLADTGFLTVPAEDTHSAATRVYFSSTPLAAGGTPQSGGYEIRLVVQKTTAVAWGPIDSNGGGTTPAGVAVRAENVGRIRARVAMSSVIASNASVGGAVPSKFAAGDNIYLRFALSAGFQRSVNIGLSMRQSNADVRQSTSSGSGANRDDTYNTTSLLVTGKGRVNTGLFAKADTVTTYRMVLPNSTLPGGDAEFAWQTTPPGGFTRVSDSTLDGTGPNVDPRITFSQLLQHNDSAWGTPPSSKNVATGRRLTSDLSFVAARAMNARGEGLANSLISWTEKLWDTGNLIGSEGSPVKSRTSTTATQGGELGWSDAFLTWDNALPGGSWTQKEVITTSEFAGLELSNTRTLALNAFDSEMIRLMLEGDLLTPAEHWTPGKSLTIGVGVMKRGVKQTIDSARIWLTRPKIGASLDATTEYLTNTRTTWATGDPGDTHAHSLSVSADDPKVFRTSFTASETAAWNSFYDVSVAGEVVVAGTPYPVSATLTVVGKRNRHGSGFLLHVGAGPVAALNRHTIVGEDVTIGIGLKDDLGATAMDASSVKYAAVRFDGVNGVLQSWNGTSWQNTSAPIYLDATIGAVATEPLLAWATLPAAAIDRVGSIRILAKATKTPSGTVVAEPYEAHFDMPVFSEWVPKATYDAHVASSISAAHSGQLPESRITFDPVSGHHHVGSDSRAIGER